MKNPAVKIKRHENGLIAVEQSTVNGFEISFNPDDDRYYVSKREPIYNDAETVATFNRMNNAVYYARTHQ